MSELDGKLFLIGDIHGKIDRYQTLLASLHADARSIQLGDVFLGRPDVHLPSMDRRHTFLQGNHDNPAVCAAHENFLGGFGYLADDLFFVSGAQTASWRVLGNSKYWYSDEQLSDADLEAAIDLYAKIRPRILVAHEFPQEAIPELLRGLSGNYFAAKADDIASRTCVALQRMIDIHRPERYYGGHYHVRKEFNLSGTTFRCLAELEMCEVPVEVSTETLRGGIFRIPKT